MSNQKLWRITGAEKNNPYELHANSKEEALVTFIDNELGLRLSLYQFNDAIERVRQGTFCILSTMLSVEEVLQ